MWPKSKFIENIEVERLYTALAENQEIYGPDHPRSVISLIMLSFHLIYRDGNLIEGLPLYYQSLAIIEQSSAETKTELIHFLKNLAKHYESTPLWPKSPICQLAEAEELYRLVLLLNKEIYASNI